MADRITHNSGIKAVSSPDGKGQGCASTKRAYVKPELILLYGNAGAGRAASSEGTPKNKSYWQAEGPDNPTSQQAVYAPS